jgi:hypothetical protein
MALEETPNIFATEILHDDVRAEFAEAGILNRYDVFVADLIGGKGPLEQTRGVFHVADGTGAKELDGNRRLRLGIDRAINLARAA